MRALRWFGYSLVVVVSLFVIAYALMWRGDIPYATLEARYAAPSSHYLDLAIPGQRGGVHLHYRDEGKTDGPVLVLVHGFSASAIDWDDWAKRLGSTYRIIAPDLPGHGLTRAPKGFKSGPKTQVAVIEAMARALNLAPFVIGGNSMGGGVAWRYALAHPERTKGLLLVDAAGWPAASGKRQDALAFKLLANPVATAVIRNLDNSALAKQGLQVAMVDKAKVTPDLVSRYVEFSRAPGHRDILTDRQNETANEATPGKLALINIPTLILFGAQDHLTPPADGERFKDAIAGSTLIVYPNLGHIPMNQDPDRTAADVMAWLAKLEAAPTAPPSHQITVRELPPPNPSTGLAR